MTQWVRARHPSRPHPPAFGPGSIGRWCDLADRGDADGLYALLDLEWAADPTLPDFVEDVLTPIQRATGERFVAGAISRAGLTLATAVVGDTIDRRVARLPPATRPSVVVACPSGEWHDLPARMVAAVVAHDGWSVSYLGPSVAPHDLERRVAELQPIAVGLSCTQTRRLTTLVGAIAAARRAGARVVVGGAALGTTDRRARALGAGAWCASAGDFVRMLHGWARKPVEAVASERAPVRAVLSTESKARIVDAALRRCGRRHPGAAPAWLGDLAYAFEVVLDLAEATLLTLDGEILAEAAEEWQRASRASALLPSAPVDALEALTASVDPGPLRSSVLQVMHRVAGHQASTGVPPEALRHSFTLTGR